MKNNVKFKVPKNGRLEERADSKIVKYHARFVQLLKGYLAVALQGPRTCIGLMKGQKEEPEIGCKLPKILALLGQCRTAQ